MELHVDVGERARVLDRSDVGAMRIERQPLPDASSAKATAP